MPDNLTTNDTLLDRKITITCAPTLIWYPTWTGASVAFTQTYGEPAAMNGRINPITGQIDLTSMPEDPAYNDNVDVTINLDTSQMFDRNRNPVAGRWAYGSEYSGTGPVTGYCWFCGTDANGNYEPSQPITIPGMSTHRLSDTAILIDDDTPEMGPAYNYCLGLVLPGLNNYYITLDPRITSKTPETA